jgi:glycosyltransferase involved in cell wall biosynthesis
LPIALDLVGPGSPQDQLRLRAQMSRVDPAGAFVRYQGMVPYAELARAYDNADAFVFASSCETFGIILLEAMAGGLPIISSHRSAMPEVVGSAATFFDPLNVPSLALAINRVFDDDRLRRSLSFQAREQARQFSWERCADETFAFVREAHERHRGGVRNSL